MGYIWRSSSQIEDSYYLSGSLWFQIDNTDDSVDVIHIYNPNEGNYFRVGVQVGRGIYVDYVQPSSGNISWLPRFPMAASRWHHLGLAIDLDHAGSEVDPMLLSLMFDGHKYDSPYSATLPLSPHNRITINGAMIGIPGLPTRSAPSGSQQFAPKIAFGPCQFWNEWIDFTNSANFSMVVSVDVTTGIATPANTATAAAAFGKQSLLFMGKASDESFFVNQGNDGTFVKVGKAYDFTLAPFYG